MRRKRFPLDRVIIDTDFTVFLRRTQCKTTLITSVGIKVVERFFSGSLISGTDRQIRLRLALVFSRVAAPVLPVLSA